MLTRCDDPLIRLVRERYGANPIRLPRTDVKPLCAVASDGVKTSSFLGAIQPLLVGGAAIDLDIDSAPVPAATLERTRSVGADIGLKLLGGFLAGWSLPGGEICAKFGGAEKVSFRFDEVTRHSVASTYLSKALAHRTIDVGNPLVSNFFGEGAPALYLIDATIASRNFTMRVETGTDASANVDVDALQKIVGKANVGVTIARTDASEISFAGTIDMPFAFSCLPIVIDENGTIANVGFEAAIPSFKFAPGEAPRPAERTLLLPHPGLLELTDPVGA